MQIMVRSGEVVMIQRIASAVLSLVLVSFPSPSRAQSGGPPPAVGPNGAARVSLAAHATRTHLLGVIELYSLAVYVDGPLIDRAQLISPDVPKALRIELRYADDLQRRVTFDWRRELIPRLEPAAITQLRGALAPLRQGDVVLIEYTPDKGTTIRVGKAVLVSGVNHDLMVAFLDHWLGQQPVSEELKRALLGSS